MTCGRRHAGFQLRHAVFRTTCADAFGHFIRGRRSGGIECSEDVVDWTARSPSSGGQDAVRSARAFCGYIGERDRVWICRRHRYRPALDQDASVSASVKKVITLQQLNAMPPRTIHRGARGDLRAVAMGCGARCRVASFRVAIAVAFGNVQGEWTLPSKRSSSRSFAPIRNWRGARRFAASWTPESTREQKGAGLASCTPEEFAALHELNLAYGKKIRPSIRDRRARAQPEFGDRETCGAESRIRLKTSASKLCGRLAASPAFDLFDLVSAPYGAENPCDVGMSLRNSAIKTMHSTCSYLTAAHRATAAKIRDWMLAAGMETSIDAVGNVIGRWCAKHRTRADASQPDRTTTPWSTAVSTMDDSEYSCR